MIDTPVRLAYENITPLKWWNQDERLPRYYVFLNYDETRKAVVIMDNVHNAWAFEVSRYFPMEYRGLIGSWDRGTYGSYHDLIRWVKENL